MAVRCSPPGLKMMQGPATPDSKLARLFFSGFSRCFMLESEAYFNQTLSELTSSGAYLYIAVDERTGEAVSGARVVTDGQGDHFFSPCYTLPEARGRGIVSWLMASARLDCFDRNPSNAADAHRSRLFVRVMNGIANPAACAAYAKVGFEKGQVYSRPISGTRLDRHLFQTSEDGVHFCTQEMTATSDTLGLCVEHIVRFKEIFRWT